MRRMLALLALLAIALHAQTAGADCGTQMAQCAGNGENFCGFAVGVVCPFQCCPADWSGCCIYPDPQTGRLGPECCPGPPDYTCAPDCQCAHPCGFLCCSSEKNEECVQTSGPGLPTFKCCPASQICGSNCCDPGEACTNGQCGCPIDCGPRCCGEDEKCINADLGVCCPATRDACGPKCCEEGEKCVDVEQGSCCPVAKEACYGNFGASICCLPDEPCCADGSVCCAKGQDCVQNRCRCQRGKRACGGADDPSAPCCSDFEQCCPTGGRTHCEPSINLCCGKSSCPPGAACCSNGECYSPAFQRCCGVRGVVCGLNEECCINAAGGCCPAGTHCCGTAGGCCPNAPPTQ